MEAHEAGIVHRDMKPGNVLVTRKGVVKIVDFGLAKLAGQTKMTKTGATVGTAAYMSPEQARGEGVDHRTDIWSWGVMLYEMLTGRAPFRGEAELALLYSITNQDPEAVTVLRPEVPIELERVVMRALEKDPKKRASSMGEVLESLKGMRAELGLLRTRGKWSLWRMKHRRVVRAAVGVLAAAVVIAAGIEFWPGGRRGDRSGCGAAAG